MASGDSQSFGGAKTVSGIFKIAAVLIIIGGVVSAISLAHHNSTIGNSQNTGGEVVGIIGGTIFAAAAVLFFAYVLDLLIAIQQNTIPSAQASAPAVPNPTAQATRRAPVYPEPGWYPDPQGIGRVRFWDGQAWTDRVQT
jgi:hypothetical protein